MAWSMFYRQSVLAYGHHDPCYASALKHSLFTRPSSVKKGHSPSGALNFSSKVGTAFWQPRHQHSYRNAATRSMASATASFPSLNSISCSSSSLLRVFVFNGHRHRQSAVIYPVIWSALRKNAFSSSTSPTTTPEVHILYASQTGTAQLLAMQFSQACSTAVPTPISCRAVQSLDEFYAQQVDHPGKSDSTTSTFSSFMDSATPPSSDATAKPIYVFVVSTAGVGELPDNGRRFCQWLLDTVDKKGRDDNLKAPKDAPFAYALFALGHSQAHPHHFCAAGKWIDQQLQNTLHAHPLLPVTCGDDAGCLEEDFDQFQSQLLARLSSITNNAAEVSQEPKQRTDPVQASTQLEPAQVHAGSNTAQGVDRPRRFPALILSPPSVEPNTLLAPEMDLLTKAPQFYKTGACRMQVLEHHSLHADPCAVDGLREIVLKLPSTLEGQSQYETGDHIVVYPRNSHLLVKAFLDILVPDEDGQGVDPSFDGRGRRRVDPYSIIQGQQDRGSMPPYPHPTGITVYETLSHCVDLSAPPSPSLTRYLLGGDPPQGYKATVADSRTTTLELLGDSQMNAELPLSDLLYQLPPLKPRYYSIASSSAVHPNTVNITYRPVVYLTRSRNIPRQGLCTSYLKSLQPSQTVVAAVQSNPTFRLPPDESVPILLVAGGCGVAPIHAFLEDLVDRRRKLETKGRPFVHLFLGFRDPADEVYTDLINEADELGLLATRRITYSVPQSCPPGISCGLVSDALVQEAATVYHDVVQRQGHVFLCGGARTFGAAVQSAVVRILQDQGHLDEASARKYLQTMIDEKRFHEDLSD